MGVFSKVMICAISNNNQSVTNDDSFKSFRSKVNEIANNNITIASTTTALNVKLNV